MACDRDASDESIHRDIFLQRQYSACAVPVDIHCGMVLDCPVCFSSIVIIKSSCL